MKPSVSITLIINIMMTLAIVSLTVPSHAESIAGNGIAPAWIAITGDDPTTPTLTPTPSPSPTDAPTTPTLTPTPTPTVTPTPEPTLDCPGLYPPAPTPHPALQPPSSATSSDTLTFPKPRTWHVAPGESIQVVVDAASPGDRIILDGDSYAETILIQTDDLLIEGGGTSPTLITGGPAAVDCLSEQSAPGQPAFIIENADGVTLHNLELRGSMGCDYLPVLVPINGGDGGPGMTISHSAVNLIDCTIIGGDGGDASPNDTCSGSISFNSSGGYGGAAIKTDEENAIRANLGCTFFGGKGGLGGQGANFFTCCLLHGPHGLSAEPFSLSLDSTFEWADLTLDFSLPRAIRNRKINCPLTSPMGEVFTWRITPDSKRVLYTANDEIPSRPHLFSAPISGGPFARRLTPDLDFDYQIVLDFLISPDGRYVVYRANMDNPNITELYSSGILCPPSVKLNISLVEGQHVGGSEPSGEIAITSDSSRVVYRVGFPYLGDYDLYSVPITGGDSTQLNLGGQSPSQYFYITPDDQFVIYRVDELLWRVPVNGGEPEPLTPSSEIGRVFHEQDGVQISQDSQWIVFRGTDPTLSPWQLYKVSVAGGAIELINSPLGNNGLVKEAFYNNWITPDSQWVVYEAWNQIPDTGPGLYKVPLNHAAQPVRLDPKDGAFNLRFAFSPNSKKVAYLMEDGVPANLFISDLNGPTSNTIQLSFSGVDGSIMKNTASLRQTFVFTPYSQSLIFMTIGNGLHRVPVSGPPATKLTYPSVNLPSNDSVLLFTISPDGTNAAFTAIRDQSQRTELYQIPLSGGEIVKMNGPLVGTGATGGDVTVDFEYSPDGQWLVYRADQDVDGVVELYSSTTTPVQHLDADVWQLQ